MLRRPRRNHRAPTIMVLSNFRKLQFSAQSKVCEPQLSLSLVHFQRPYLGVAPHQRLGDGGLEL